MGHWADDGGRCYEDKVYLTLEALDQTLRKYGVELYGELHKLFVTAMG